MRRSLVPVLTGAILAFGLAACSSTGERERQQFVEQPVEFLYNDAARLLDQRRWTEAAAAFQEVERQHPYSTWARRSLLMTAYSQYMSNAYDDAIGTAQRFVSLHPGNVDAPYAYYLIAICKFEQILDVGRDQKTTEESLQALQEVVRRFPESEYARDARLKLDMVNDQLAGKEMEVGRFYLRQGQTLAAVNRFRNVVDNPGLQRTSHTPEALHRLVEGYVTLGLVDDAQRTAAVLGYNFPGSEWYQRSYALLTGRGIAVASEDDARKRGWLSRLIPG